MVGSLFSFLIFTFVVSFMLYECTSCLFAVTHTQKNEACFKCQRSLLQVPMKLASLGIEAIFIFFAMFLGVVVCFNDFS